MSARQPPCDATSPNGFEMMTCRHLTVAPQCRTRPNFWQLPPQRAHRLPVGQEALSLQRKTSRCHRLRAKDPATPPVPLPHDFFLPCLADTSSCVLSPLQVPIHRFVTNCQCIGSVLRKTDGVKMTMTSFANKQRVEFVVRRARNIHCQKRARLTAIQQQAQTHVR